MIIKVFERDGHAELAAVGRLRNKVYRFYTKLTNEIR